MKTTHAPITLALAAALTLAACSLPTVAPPPRLFDFGPLAMPHAVGAAEGGAAAAAGTASGGAPSTATSVVLHITAADDVDTPAMRYRLLYTDPRAVLAYRDSRWVASPAQLLRACLAPSVVAPGATSDVHVELLAFEQAFAAPGRSQLHAHASVVWEVAGQARAARVDVRVDAAPDAAGLAAAAAPACERLAGEVTNALSAP
ncbi:MAG: hypothetical protein JO224_12060 [Pelomonas sp.]|nr:hypothetical protein [Roseateles sp.]